MTSANTSAFESLGDLPSELVVLVDDYLDVVLEDKTQRLKLERLKIIKVLDLSPNCVMLTISFIMA